MSKTPFRRKGSQKREKVKSTWKDYERIGRTKKGETVYRHKPKGRFFTEKGYTRLAPSTKREIREARESGQEEKGGD